MLIYGLKDEREKYHSYLIMKDPTIKNLPVYINDYNDELSSILENEWINKQYSEWGANSKDLSFQMSCWDSEENFLNFIKELPIVAKSSKNYPLWEIYFDHFQINSKHQLQIIYKEELREIQKNSKYIFNSFYPNTSLHLERGNKIGLEMAKSMDNLEVYYVLDGIDLESVVFKDKERFEGSMTSSELRYIYRNWVSLKEKIIFIENNERVIAPWEKDPELWKNYQPKKKQELSNLEPEKKQTELNDLEPEKKQSELSGLKPEKKQTELSDLEHEKKNQELHAAEPEKKVHKRSELEQKKKMQDLNKPQLEKKAQLEITKTSQAKNNEQTKNKHSLIKRMGNGIWKRIKNVFPHSNKKSVDLHKNLPNIENGKTSPVVARSYRQYPLPQTSQSSESKLKDAIKLSQITSNGLNERKKRNKKATHSLMIE